MKILFTLFIAVSVWFQTTTDYEGSYRCKRERKSLYERVVNGDTLTEIGYAIDSCTIVISRTDKSSNTYQVNIAGKTYTMNIRNNRIDGGRRFYGKFTSEDDFKLSHVPSQGPNATHYYGVRIE